MSQSGWTTTSEVSSTDAQLISDRRREQVSSTTTDTLAPHILWIARSLLGMCFVPHQQALDHVRASGTLRPGAWEASSDSIQSMQQQLSGMQSQLYPEVIKQSQADLVSSSAAQRMAIPAESHFGVHAFQHSISMLSDWAMTSLSWVEASEPESLLSLSGALNELKEVSQLLSSKLPGKQ